MKKTSQVIVLVLFAILLGFLVMRQIVVQKDVKTALSAPENQLLSQEVAQLYRQSEKLRKENSELKEEKLKLTESMAGREEANQIADETIAKLKVVSAEYPISGEGVKVWINHYLALTQLVDLINAVRNSGAEALTINGKRMGPKTAFDQAAESYYLEIIGNKDILAEALSRQGGILEQIGMGNVEKTNYLVLPAVD